MIRLAKSYGNDRADAACRRALSIHSPSYRSVQTILKHKLDDKPLRLVGDDDLPLTAATRSPVHENVRGAEYFDKGETKRHTKRPFKNARS